MLVLLVFWVALSVYSDPLTQPLVTLSDLTNFKGAFRIPASAFGGTGDAYSINYGGGGAALYNERNSIFLVGHEPSARIAEFTIPELIRSYTPSELNLAEHVQGFTSVLDRISNPEGVDRIGGMYAISDELVFDAYMYYDASTSVTYTTGVIRDLTDIDSSEIQGYFTIDGGPGHTTGWISPVPPEWISLVAGDHIAGDSSGIPIIGRCSVGPSAFSLNIGDLVGGDEESGTIATTKLLDYYLDPSSKRLAEDLSNDYGNNTLWTHLSRAIYGFIVPGSRTYAVLGSSGGHDSHVCYKCTRSCGEGCGGYCSFNCTDDYFYYWLYDMNDLLEVKDETVSSWTPKPYEWGKFPSAFNSTRMISATYDPTTSNLYVVEYNADDSQGEYARPPIITVYEIDADSFTPDDPPDRDSDIEDLGSCVSFNSVFFIFSILVISCIFVF